MANLEAAILVRVDAAGLNVDAQVLRGCAEYLALLTRWNRRMNLTALPLDVPPASATVDKLIVEPLVATSLMRPDDVDWLDLGSGGGSPALPLRLTHRIGTLRMVESRARKCAFLREAVRTLGLARTHVVESRYESLHLVGDQDVVTLRALRVDEQLLKGLRQFLRPSGRVFAFGGWPAKAAGFREISRHALPGGSELQVLARA